MAKSGKPASTPSAELGPTRAGRLRRALLAWYDSQGRRLPWRETADPYAIWVSEAMLQQTQVATVIPYFERWMRRFPTAAALAEADEQEVLLAWAGLGYYSRARNLHAAARVLLERHGGALPSQVTALSALPGVGAYTAAAVASIAFGRPAAVVDGNVKRVLARLLALEGHPGQSSFEARVAAAASALLDRGRPGDFNQAVMELGATVCRPRSADCGSCPIRRDCAAFAQGAVDRFPAPRPRPKSEAVHMAAAVVRRGSRVLLVQLPHSAPRWAGLWQFPSAEHPRGRAPARVAARIAGRLLASRATHQGRLVVVRHAVTRFSITLEAHAFAAASLELQQLDAAPRWVSVRDLSNHPLPAAHAKIARALGE
ncbi:MAG: A/G-specific adenine glycosylase [Polyangiaceae bacterium]|nr:A/G-specific adenine glycosylase [Polyangiaceae bacterium]